MVNALSEHMDVTVYKNGQIHHDAYERGIPTVKLVDGLLPVIGKTRETGTKINFMPDGEIFEKTRFKAEWLKSRLHETAYLNPRLSIHYENKRAGEAEKITYSEPEGILAYVKELNSTKTPVHEPFYFKGTSENIEVEVAFQFVDTFEENVLGFCNNIFTTGGRNPPCRLQDALHNHDQQLCQGAWNPEGEGFQLYGCGHEKRNDGRDCGKTP